MLSAPVCQYTPEDVTLMSPCKAPFVTLDVWHVAPHQHLRFNLCEVTSEVSPIHALIAHRSETDRGSPYSFHSLNAEIQPVTVLLLNNLKWPSGWQAPSLTITDRAQQWIVMPSWKWSCLHQLRQTSQLHNTLLAWLIIQMQLVTWCTKTGLSFPLTGASNTSVPSLFLV